MTGVDSRFNPFRPGSRDDWGYFIKKSWYGEPSGKFGNIPFYIFLSNWLFFLALKHTLEKKTWASVSGAGGGGGGWHHGSVPHALAGASYWECIYQPGAPRWWGLATCAPQKHSPIILLRRFWILSLLITYREGGGGVSPHTPER